VKRGQESTLPSVCDQTCFVHDPEEDVLYVLKRPNKDMPKRRTLAEIIGVRTGGPQGRRHGEPNHTVVRYEEFLDFVE
jgi:hypothetical protein